jgi:hypothetical protein
VNKLIVSLFDRTGNWAKPYARAGYAVQLWDLEHEGDILEHFDRICRLVEQATASGFTFQGLITAPPCDHFAGSGARWWKEKDLRPPAEGDTWNIIDYACGLVEIVLHLVELYRPKWWVLENPVGRIEKLCPVLKPYRRMSFDPWHYGDGYTKKTILWGEFNTALCGQQALFVEKTFIHHMPPGPERAKKRSATPPGFAKAFFNANP